jgi:hypothetical protein
VLTWQFFTPTPHFSLAATTLLPLLLPANTRILPAFFFLAAHGTNSHQQAPSPPMASSPSPPRLQLLDAHYSFSLTQQQPAPLFLLPWSPRQQAGSSLLLPWRSSNITMAHLIPFLKPAPSSLLPAGEQQLHGRPASSSMAPRFFFSRELLPHGASSLQVASSLSMASAPCPPLGARPCEPPQQADLHCSMPTPPVPLLSTPFPLPRHILSLIYGTGQQQPWRPFFSAQRRRSKRQQPRTPSVSLACHPLDVLRSHIVAARCPTTRSPSIFPVGAAAPTSPRDSLLCAAQRTARWDARRVFAVLRSPNIVAVHPGETTTILV